MFAKKGRDVNERRWRGSLADFLLGALTSVQGLQLLLDQTSACERAGLKEDVDLSAHLELMHGCVLRL